MLASRVWRSLEVTACGPLSGTEAGAPWHQLCCCGGQAWLRFADEFICKCATASSTPFDLLTTLVKWSFQLHLRVENFLVIRGSHWQEYTWNYIFGPYPEPILGICNWSTRSFPYVISLQSMGTFSFFFFFSSFPFFSWTSTLEQDWSLWQDKMVAWNYGLLWEVSWFTELLYQVFFFLIKA